MKKTIGIVSVLVAVILCSGFAYWSSTQLTNKIYAHTQRVDFSFYAHRGAIFNPRMSPIPTIEDKIEELDELAYDKMYRKALAGYQGLLEEDPSNIELLLRVGILYLREGDLNTAQDYLYQVLGDEESIYGMDAKWFLALIQLQHKQNEKAKEYLRFVAGTRGNYYRQAGELLADLKI